jgi:type II secretory pathway pseudopilin PulG
MGVTRHPAHRQGGFTYLAILFAVAISSVALAGMATLWSVEEQRDREKALLFAGAQYRQAIASYVESTPGEEKAYPMSLEALLEDRRFNPPRRHLRRLYPDPVSEPASDPAAAWILIKRSDGSVGGVHSASRKAPLQRAHFDQADEDFAGKEHYADWKFVYVRHKTKHMPAVFLPVP